MVRLGAELTAAYPDGVVLVGVLKGSVPFLADVVRAMTVPTEIDFLAISSYAEGTGRVRIVKDLDADICGRDVVLVEDIVDTGLTVSYVLGELRRRQPSTRRGVRPARQGGRAASSPSRCASSVSPSPTSSCSATGWTSPSATGTWTGWSPETSTPCCANPDAHVHELYQR